MPVGAVGEAETGFDGGRRACPEVRRTCSVLEADSCWMLLSYC